MVAITPLTRGELHRISLERASTRTKKMMKTPAAPSTPIPTISRNFKGEADAHVRDQKLQLKRLSKRIKKLPKEHKLVWPGYKFKGPKPEPSFYREAEDEDW